MCQWPVSGAVVTRFRRVHTSTVFSFIIDSDSPHYALLSGVGSLQLDMKENIRYEGTIIRNTLETLEY